MANTSDKKTKKTHDFSIPVHRSIIKRDLWLGIPFVPIVSLAFITIILVLGFGQPAFLAITVILTIVLRQITKEDEWLLDTILDSLFQPDDFY
jgi:type IV secretory pathway VirB3-like protein